MRNLCVRFFLMAYVSWWVVKESNLTPKASGLQPDNAPCVYALPKRRKPRSVSQGRLHAIYASSALRCILRGHEQGLIHPPGGILQRRFAAAELAMPDGRYSLFHADSLNVAGELAAVKSCVVLQQ